jgi:hypothetical protein
MPRGPKGERRPADVIGNAVHVMKILTGEIEDTIPDDGKDPAAVASSRLWTLMRQRKRSLQKYNGRNFKLRHYRKSICR